MVQSDKQKPQKSRAKFIFASILLIVIIGSILIIPRCNRYYHEKRAAEIKTALDKVRENVDQEWKKNGSISGITIQGIEKKAEISPKILENWQFVVAWKLTEIYTTEMVNKLKDVNTNQTVYVSPYKMIMAVAKPKNPVGEGTKIWFDGDNNSYHGFGIDDKIEPDWTVMFPNP